jgi:hypothetical protein
MQPPKVLDIQKIAQPSSAELVSKIIHELAKVGASNEANQKMGDDTMVMSKALISISSQAWRLKTAVNDPESGEMKTELSAQEMRKVANASEAINQAIEELGIRVIDRCNQDFHPGLPDQVVTEEPRAGISKEQIIRTIRPTIMWHQTMVQRGEIDIAVPTTKK